MAVTPRGFLSMTLLGILTTAPSEARGSGVVHTAPRVIIAAPRTHRVSGHVQFHAHGHRSHHHNHSSNDNAGQSSSVAPQTYQQQPDDRHDDPDDDAERERRYREDKDLL